MSSESRRRVTVTDFLKAKGQRKLVMIATYDYLTAKIVDEAGVDGILIGDSVIMNLYGFPTTHYATIRDIVRHTQAVANARPRALIVADMPFMTYETSREDALRNATKLIRAGADAVKVEGGVEIADKVEALVKAGIPVMGHIGLTPQRVLKLGGYKLMGKAWESALQLVEDAKALEEAGVFSIVIEFTAAEVAAEITRRVKVPTICIGSGPDCDGQIIVLHDIIGLSEIEPFFAKRYVNVRDLIRKAVLEYVQEVREGKFPSEQHYRRMPREEYEKFKLELEKRHGR